MVVPCQTQELSDRFPIWLDFALLPSPPLYRGLAGCIHGNQGRVESSEDLKEIFQMLSEGWGSKCNVKQMEIWPARTVYLSHWKLACMLLKSKEKDRELKKISIMWDEISLGPWNLKTHQTSYPFFLILSFWYIVYFRITLIMILKNCIYIPLKFYNYNLK